MLRRSEDKDKPLTPGEIVFVTTESILKFFLPLGIIVFFILRAIYMYGPKSFWFLGQHLGERGAELVLVVIICGIGWLAHQLKKRQQGIYGFIEVFFGIFYAATTAFSMVPGSSSTTQWATLFGCTYIIVRGMSNMREAKAAKKKSFSVAS